MHFLANLTIHSNIFILTDIFCYWDKSAIYFNLDLKHKWQMLDTKGVFCSPVSVFIGNRTKRKKIHNEMLHICVTEIHYCHCFTDSFLPKEKFTKNTILLIIDEKLNSGWEVSKEEKSRATINIRAQFLSNWFLRYKWSSNHYLVLLFSFNHFSVLP